MSVLTFPSNIQGQPVLVLGLGVSGLAMARWCTRLGAQVTVADTRQAPPQRAQLQQACPSAVCVSGPFNAELMARESWVLVARSPGLSPSEVAAAAEWAQAHSVPLVGELELFAQALQALAQRQPWPYQPHVLAITGTNGKTTVTSLTALLLERSGAHVAVAGNIGPALLDVLSDALDHELKAQVADAQTSEASDAAALVEPPTEPAELAGGVEAAADAPVVIDADTEADSDESEPTESDTAPQLVPPPLALRPPPHLPTVWVLELSSFQLHEVAGSAWDAVPTMAALLNVSEDHLDWHGNMGAYAQAKAAVFGANALMLLNRDDARVMALQPALVNTKVGARNRQLPARAFATFGLDVPTAAGDWGIETTAGMDWLVRALALDETRKPSRRAGQAPEDSTYLQRLMPADALRIRGRHNAANALAALALASSTGAALGAMLHGLREYRGEPNRVQPVAIVDGVEFFNDSKGTNVGATLAAVNGLGAERRVVVILGGDGKGQDFTPLQGALAQHARAVVLIGRDAAAIRQAIVASQVPMFDASSLPEAVRLCAAHAQAGDAVLLSPACASFDMFDGYVHRAQVFIDAVTDWAHERGQTVEVAA